MFDQRHQIQDVDCKPRFTLKKTKINGHTKTNTLKCNECKVSRINITEK